MALRVGPWSSFWVASKFKALAAATQDGLRWSTLSDRLCCWRCIFPASNLVTQASSKSHCVSGLVNVSDKIAWDMVVMTMFGVHLRERGLHKVLVFF
eukprot:3586095-Amphidinium_carterae.2